MERDLDPSDVEGFIIKNKTGHTHNCLRDPVDINKLPILNFSLFGDDFLKKPMMGKLYRTISIELTRGCPYKCTYCGNAWLANMFKDNGGWYRLKSIEKIDREFREYIDKYDPEFIYKHSESFLAVSTERFDDYMDMYSVYAIPYWIETRPEDISEKKAKRLASTNCKRVSIGLESGNEIYRKKMLKRHHTNKKVRESCAILKDMGISFSMNLIIGLPEETREMVFDGIELLRSVKPDGTSIFLYTPYKGSTLRQFCVDHGMIDSEFIGGDYFTMRYCLRNNTLKEDEVLGLYRTIPLYVQLPRSDFPKIRMAEKMTPEGNKIFGELKEEYYELMGWNKI